MTDNKVCVEIYLIFLVSMVVLLIFIYFILFTCDKGLWCMKKLFDFSNMYFSNT